MNTLARVAGLMLAFACCGAAYAGTDGRPDISGVWSNALLTPDDERWRIEDLACARSGCSMAGFKYLQSLLRDPGNDDRTVKELFYEMRGYEQEQNSNLLTPRRPGKTGRIRPGPGRGPGLYPGRRQPAPPDHGARAHGDRAVR